MISFENNWQNRLKNSRFWAFLTPYIRTYKIIFKKLATIVLTIKLLKVNQNRNLKINLCCTVGWRTTLIESCFLGFGTYPLRYSKNSKYALVWNCDFFRAFGMKILLRILRNLWCRILLQSLSKYGTWRYSSSTSRDVVSRSKIPHKNRDVYAYRNKVDFQCDTAAATKFLK